ncbi:DUF5719 family protein [Janibacter cremeus]|uniref:Secreted protein n=1 Tax=Janibacter cremeus TaxID=1285192 RepID=A0A852VT69_9MICO|nr:DUF5719 family protein [Janibacter cremeus]NYF99118.1 hypothetical protein [Janibacter cremeus]
MTSPSGHRRAWAHPVARVIAVGALSAGIVLGVDRLGAVPTDAAPQVAGKQVAATSVTAYCPGDPFTDKSEVDVTGEISAHTAPGPVLEGVITPSEEPGEISIRDLSTDPSSDTDQDEPPRSGPTDLVEDELDGPVRVRARQHHAPGAVMSQSFVAGGERATGLAAMPCTAPIADAWLVSGGAEDGRQEHLVLTNPGANAVSVTLDALGAKGEESVVVPPRDRTVVLLDAIGGTDAPQAVHVSSSNGLVVPTIVDHHLDGLVPAGVETTAATTSPSRRQVIPAGAGGDERGVVVGAPGGSDAVVQVRSLGEDGSRSASVETVPAGSAVDLDLPEQESGVHGWLVESDEPVVAAAHLTTRAPDGTRDMAWSVATTAVRSLGGVALPATTGGDVTRSVSVTADEEPATAEVLALRDGEVTKQEVSLAAGHSTAVPVAAAEAVWVRPTSGVVHAAALLVGGDGAEQARATSLPIESSRVAVRDIEVVHQR